MLLGNEPLIIPETREVKRPRSFWDDWRVVLACLSASALLGAIHALGGRQIPHPRISLHRSDVIRRGDWANAVNAYWAPLYPATLAMVLGILKPSPYWEF